MLRTNNTRSVKRKTTDAYERRQRSEKDKKDERGRYVKSPAREGAVELGSVRGSIALRETDYFQQVTLELTIIIMN